MDLRVDRRVKQQNVDPIILTTDVLNAFEKGELSVVYQSKINVETRKVVGVEVLLRWSHPIYGYVPPEKWLKVAETAHLMRPLTQWVLSQAIAYLKATPKSSTTVAVNISPTIFDETLVDTVLTQLAQAGVPSMRLELELTEEAVPNDMSLLGKVVQQLRNHGIKVAIDDFGVGYSTMQYLVELPVDCVKIDKSIVQKAPTNKSAWLILRSLIELSHEIGLSVICEGVETAEQLEMVRSFGCDIVQGYFFGLPLSAEVAVARSNQEFNTGESKIGFLMER